jgi:hypothetical protein
MSTTKNTSYKVHVFHTNQSEVDAVNIEDGAMLHTDDALYMGHNNNNVVVYPQNVTTIGGWARYDDTTYTSASKLTLVSGVQVTLPNNAGAVYRSHPSITFYNSSTQKILGVNENDVYFLTVAFKASAANANQTFLEYNLEGTGQISRVAGTMTFPRGNDVVHIENILMQYYIDADFVANGVDLKFNSIGGDTKIWDIIYFIQRTQNADFS